MAKAHAPAPKISAPPPPTTSKVLTNKTFTVAPWTRSNEGAKVMIYGPSGMGKTTLAAMAPDPVFIGVDDGGGLIPNPKTGEPVLHVPGIETFADVRAALQSNVFDDHASIVLDTVTMLQYWVLPYMFQTIKHDKTGTPTSIEDYGYGKGYRHLFDTMHLILTDCERLLHKGKNIILIAQGAKLVEKNEAGEDYMKDGPNLHHSDKISVRRDYVEWCDHIVRVTWEGASVKGKKISPVSGRMIDVAPDATFEAKSRGPALAGIKAVSFATNDDDSLWSMLFGGE